MAMCEVSASLHEELRDSASSASSASSSASLSGSSCSDESYEPPEVQSDTAAVKQLGKVLLRNETAMMQRELIATLPDEHIDHLSKKDHQIHKINKKANKLEAQSFPLKLHTMLIDCELEGFSDVVSWQPGGTSFKVHKPTEFAKVIMGRYFRQTKYKSFQRQLNLYGFTRIHHGVNKGGYEHRFFTKERPSLLDSMNRQKLQAHSVPKILKLCTTKTILNEAAAVKKHKRAPSDLSVELFNSSMDLSVLDIADKAHELADKIFVNAGLEDDADMVEESEMLTNFLLDGEDTRSHRHRRRSSSGVFDDIEDDPVFRALLQDSFLTISEDDIVADIGDEDISDMFDKDHVIPEGKAVNDETLPSFCTSSLEASLPPANDADLFTKSPVNEHSFPWKLHDMLTQSEADGFQHIVSWAKDGTVFCVHDQKEFVENIMPLFFDQTKYESFRRQLNLYGFTRVVRGPLRGNYMHKSFIRSERALCKDIVRNVPPKGKAKS